MKIKNKYSLLDIQNEIDFFIANEINAHFIVAGDVADHIVGYLEAEHEMPQFSEYSGERDKLYTFTDYEAYTISIVSDNDYMYFVQESYYHKTHGKILAELGGEDDIVYIQSETNLSLQDLKRVHSKETIIFDLEENECCRCDEHEASTIDTLSRKIKTLEDRVAELVSHKTTYIVNDVKVNKKVYDEFYDSSKPILPYWSIHSC